MALYILKLSVGLLVFWGVYVLLIEKQSTHQFKRFYLLGSLVISAIIPLMTITTYVDPLPLVEVPQQIIIEPVTNSNLAAGETETTLSLATILWTVYAMGVLLFLLRFNINLSRLLKKIRKHERVASTPFIYVLLNQALAPHSFFNYLFFNKSDYAADRIPQEVLIHEEAHAKQLHSLDILFIELLQIIMWFNPLIYVLKHHIKLNHEFLADHAVLTNGVSSNRYQNILLDYLSHQQSPQLSSSINYSSIKKRITVMKTQTSKTTVVLSRLLLLPLTVVLFYNFAERNYVEKEFNLESKVLEDSNISNSLFYVTLEKKGDVINLKCEEGCKWNHLVLEPRPEPYIINDYGFSNGKTLNSDKFSFTITSSSSGVDLNGLKGTAWIDLNFYLPENQVQAVNELGMTKTKLVKKKQSEATIPLRIEAVNDELFINYHKIAIEDYAEVLNAFTSNWTAENFKASMPDLIIDNCSQDFLDQLDQEFRNTDYFAINIQGSKQPNNNDTQPDQEKDKTKTIRQAIAFVKADSILRPYRQTSYEPKEPLRGEREREIKDFESSIYVNNPDKRKQPMLKSAVDIISGTKDDNAESKQTTKLKTGFLKVNTQTLYYTVINGQTSYYNSKGYKTDKTGRTLSKERTKANEVLPDAYVTKVYKDDKVVVEFARVDGSVDNSVYYQDGVSKKQLAAYNAWAKGLNAKDIGDRIVKQKDYENYFAIYSDMSESQRANAEPFPALPPPPPPPPAPVVIEVVEEPTVIEIKEVPPPPPPPTPVVIEVVEEPTVIEIKEVPPPPPPPKPLEHMKELAAKGADFYYEGEKISAKKAINIVSKNEGLNFKVKEKNQEKPVVYITKAPIVHEVKKQN